MNPWKFEHAQVEDAPLYAPEVQPLNIDKIIDRTTAVFGIQDVIVQQLLAVRRWLTDPTLHQQGDTHGVACNSLLTEDDVEKLMAAKLLNELSDITARATVRAFARPEQKNRAWRRRTIFHTLAGNNGARMPHPTMMRVNSLAILQAMAFRNCLAFSRDFKSFYHQLKFSPAVAQCYVLKSADRVFTLTRAAMGHKASAACAHTISKAIARLAVAMSGKHGEYDVIIDDVCIFTKDIDSATTIAQRFDDLCAEFNVQIGSRSDPADQVSHRGLDFDLRNKRVKIRASTRERATARIEDYQARPTTTKARSLLGSLISAAQVLPHLDITRLLRNVSSYMAGGPPACFASVADALRQDTAIRPHVNDLPFIGMLVADATPTGYGAIYINQYGQVSTTCGHFHTPYADIAEAEAHATIIGMHELVPARRSLAALVVLTDNMVWLASMARQWARSEKMEYWRTMLAMTAQAKNVVFSERWVPSEWNPTDTLSRQFVYTAADAVKIERLLR